MIDVKKTDLSTNATSKSIMQWTSEISLPQISDSGGTKWMNFTLKPDGHYGD
jgi:hypothetical protein